ERLEQGERIKEILKQPQYQPMGVEYQVIIIYAATKKLLLDVATEEIQRFEKELFEYIDTKHADIPEEIREKKALSPELESKLADVITEFKKIFL
ncbi:MAG: F0F1 ATP synthase subunit alpha, partial [Lachnospiraceae bacterium]|nr:F0F1 ATP synthase subunit alpha [Lachnospiraceae bacterium]